MIHEIVIPVMDQATESVVLTTWRKQEGQAVHKGEVICDIETEKATVEVEANGDGVLRKVLVVSGTRVPPRTVVGLIAAAGEVLPDLARYRRGEPRAAAAEARPGPAQVGAPVETSSKPRERLVASPRARRLAEELGVDLRTVRSSGPDGRIQEQDVRNALAAPAAAPAASVGRAARAKAARVSLSWQTIPHFYTSLTVDLSQTAKRKAAAPPGVTYTDFFALALGQVLARHSRLNSHWTDDGPRQIADIRLGLVVDTDHGLLLPVLSDLRSGSLATIAAERERLVRQAVSGKMQPAGGGATFTLSNIGAGHIDSFTALISPPQVAILSVGSIQPRPLVVADDLEIRPAATLTLGVDHRAIDGRQAAAFLEDLKAVLEAQA